MNLYNEIVEGATNSRLIREGWLLPTRVFAPSEPDITALRPTAGKEYNQVELQGAVEDCTAYGDIFKEYDKYLDRQGITFAPGVAYCYGLAERYNKQYGPGTAEVIEGATSKRDRTKLFDKYDAGDLRMLVSVDVLKEGFDCSASLGIDLQPNHQLRTYVQKVGRVRRPRGTHKEAIWIDMAGNYWRFPHPDEDIDWLAVTEDATTQDVIQEARTEKKKAEPTRCPGCGGVPLSWPDGKCAMCGFGYQKPKRYIRMGNGTVREVPVEHKVKKQKSADQKAWDAARYKAHYCGQTLAQAKWKFKQATGYWPPDGLDCMPVRDSLDWQREPSVVYPFMKKRRQPAAVS